MVFGRLAPIGLTLVLMLPAVPAGPVALAQAPAHERPTMAVAISAGGSGDAHVGQPLPVAVHVRGAAPVAAVEVWQNDRLAATLPAQASVPATAFAWTWVPQETGDVVLFARAFDEAGRAGQSNAIHIRVAGDPGGRRNGEVNLSRATTPQAMGTAADTIAVEFVGCRLRVDPASDRLGSAVLHLSPTAAAFTSLEPPPSTGPSGQYEVLAGPGLHLLTAVWPEAGGVRYGRPAALTVPPRCGRLGWLGDARLATGRLRVPAKVDRGYLYVQVDGGAAVRVPADPGAFVAARDGILDFSEQLPSLEGEQLSFEAWGWAGDKLVDLGTGRFDLGRAIERSKAPAADTAPAALVVPDLGPFVGVGAHTSLDLVVLAGGGEIKQQLARDGGLEYPTTPPGQPIKRTLRWETNQPGVTGLVWQVLPYTPGSSADLSPPFLVDAWSEQVPTGTTAGTFGIDFGLYLEKPVAVASAALEPAQGIRASIPGDPILPGASPGTGDVGVVSQVSPPGSVVLEPFLDAPVGFLGDFYVRVVPMAGGVPLPPSNHVRLTVEGPDAGGTLVPKVPACPTCGSNPNALQLSWQVSLPRPADAKYTACAVVTGFTDDYVKPSKVSWPYTYEVGKVFCPDPPDDGWSLLDAFAAAVGFVGDVWDYVSSSYAWVKAQIVSAVLTAVPCEAIADKSVCQTIAEVALDSVAVGFGVPPSIPDWESTMEAVKGDVVTYIVENASEQFPAVALACDVASAGKAGVTSDIGDCEDLAEAAVHEVIDQMQAARSQAAGGATGKAYPGVIFAPDPRGQWQPPSVTFTATRTSDPVQPQTCWVNAGMTSRLDGWKWPELVAGKVEQATGTVSGAPFLPGGYALPPLAAGESVTRTIWLDDYAIWFESPDSAEYWHYAEGLANANRAWVLLQQGSQLTFEISSNCGPKSSIGPLVLPKTAAGQ